MAWLEMRLALAKVLWNFDLSLCKESQDWMNHGCYLLWEKTPLMVVAAPRLRGLVTEFLAEHVQERRRGGGLHLDLPAVPVERAHPPAPLRRLVRSEAGPRTRSTSDAPIALLHHLQCRCVRLVCGPNRMQVWARRQPPR